MRKFIFQRIFVGNYEKFCLRSHFQGDFVFFIIEWRFVRGRIMPNAILGEYLSENVVIANILRNKITFLKRFMLELSHRNSKITRDFPGKKKNYTFLGPLKNGIIDMLRDFLA